jgi:hypothetical protein
LVELPFDDQYEHHQICQEQQQLVLVFLQSKKQPTRNTHFETNLARGFWDFRFILAVSNRLCHLYFCWGKGVTYPQMFKRLLDAFLLGW